MSQHDLSIANQGFPAFRSDLNDALQALGSLSSGSTAPSTTYANMLWYDTANNIIKIRNEDNDAWISLFTLDQTGDAIASMTIPAISGNVNFDSGTLYVDATNNRVGIGTSSPVAVLTVMDGNLLLDKSSDAGSTSVYFGDTSDNTVGAVTYNHDSNYMYFATNGNEALRINSSGNVGIGTSSPANKLHISASSSGTNDLLVVSRFDRASSGTAANGLGGQLELSSQDNAGSSRTAAWINWKLADVSNAAPKGYISLGARNSSEALRIDDSGNIAIGTNTTAGYRLDISGGNLRVANSGTLTTGSQGTYALQVGNGDPDLTFGLDSSYGYIQTWASKKLYLNSQGNDVIVGSGNLLVGTTTSGGDGLVFLPNTDNGGAINVRKSSSAGSGSRFIIFDRGGGQVGSITYNGSGTNYNTSSDYRLKENILPMTGALDTVSQLKPVTYKWKADGSDGQGFIAHELQAVVPDCVTGEKDAIETYIDEEGIEQTRPIYQGIDTSFLVATLTAAIQELKAEVDSLKAQLNA